MPLSQVHSVLFGTGLSRVYEDALNRNYAIPAVNVYSSSYINAVLRSARMVESPVIVQLSPASSHFFAGRSLSNQDFRASVAGAISAASHVHEVSPLYEVPVILHTDHADRSQLPWLDHLIMVGERHFSKFGCPLFSSHMIDLSSEPVRDNIETCKEYLEKLTSMGMMLEIELGVTGGIEEGMDHSEIYEALMYTTAEDVYYAYEELAGISDRFLIAASFGNKHGMYAPGEVNLKPTILRESQALVANKTGSGVNPVKFVFHGGSGCTVDEIRDAINYGTVKVNINTELQWAYWEGVKRFYSDHSDYLQSPLGNPDANHAHNKKYFDPQIWLEKAEDSLVSRLVDTFKNFNACGRILA